jgi:hypothetical protein
MGRGQIDDHHLVQAAFVYLAMGRPKGRPRVEYLIEVQEQGRAETESRVLLGDAPSLVLGVIRLDLV